MMKIMSGKMMDNNSLDVMLSKLIRLVEGSAESDHLDPTVLQQYTKILLNLATVAKNQTRQNWQEKLDKIQYLQVPSTPRDYSVNDYRSSGESKSDDDVKMFEKSLPNLLQSEFKSPRLGGGGGEGDDPQSHHAEACGCILNGKNCLGDEEDSALQNATCPYGKDTQISCAEDRRSSSSSTDCCELKSTVEKLKNEICKLKKMVLLGSSPPNYIRAKSSSAQPALSPRCPTNLTAIPLQDRYVVVAQKSGDANRSPCNEVIRTIQESLTKSIADLDERFESFAKCINCTLNRITESITGEQNNENICERIREIEGQLEEFEKTIEEIVKSEGDRDQEKINCILQEQIATLRINKAEKELVEDALAQKADVWALNKKVDLEQFNTACEGLARGLEEATDKMTQLEALWLQSFDELQQLMSEKVGKDEFNDFNNQMQEELDDLRQKINSLLQVKEEVESAGARKILKGMRCIACDKDAYVKRDSAKMHPDAFPCRKSNKPYLVFKTEDVRKQKNIEDNIRYHKAKEGADNLREEARRKVVNRYCGGSHTIVTPRQRVNATRNFVSQNGIQDLKLVTGFVEGNDGQVYKGNWFVDNGRDPVQETNPVP